MAFLDYVHSVYKQDCQNISLLHTLLKFNLCVGGFLLIFTPHDVR